MNIKTHRIIFLTTLFFSSLCYGNQKKVIVIGASAGIGRAIAHEFATHNHQVGITARRTHLLQELQTLFAPEQITIDYMDIGEFEQSRKTFIDMVNRMGGVDIVIINAATFPNIPEDFTIDKYLDWQEEKQLVHINVLGFLALANQAINFFMEQGHGHLVGISSVDAVRGIAAGPVYSASKSFMANYLEGIRNRFIQSNVPIDVTEIRPGYVQTQYEMPESAYWVSTPEEVAVQIYESIQQKEKVAYVTRRWKLIGFLLQHVPDWLYNKLGGF